MNHARQPIGFMQGRLSPKVDGKIQAFPVLHWREEFFKAERLGFRLMEWTLDQEGLYENPLMTAHGQETIRLLCRNHGIGIPSLTGDCFMQAPFWKAAGLGRAELERDFLAVAEASAKIGIRTLVVPLVDNGRLDSRDQEDGLISFLQQKESLLAQCNLVVVFESDFEPAELARFIGRLSPLRFGINYDMGNSAALGYDPKIEFAAYGQRVLNVHVKDRLLGGTTVPLGTGNADFATVFGELASIGYRGNFILQTARAAGDGHEVVLARYRDMTVDWMRRSGLA